MTTAIITVFVVGYLFIALESLTKINKAGIAILMGIACWVLLLMGASEYGPAIIDKALKIGILSEESARNIMENYSSYMCRGLFQHYLAEVSETILFLMGAMTVVETVDSHGGFRFVKKALYTPNPKSLLWKVCIMTFFLSATLDNMTTSIVMIMVLKSLISDKELRMKFAGMVIIAANAGGAFSPIGDVTTI
ncbi:MAG: sodium:proton antiporter, partial [Bacteroidales bacterium]|nr:sodium:proton antiporter [Bacteroidales bacterium]